MATASLSGQSPTAAAAVERAYRVDLADAHIASETAEANADRDWKRVVTLEENTFTTGYATATKTLLDDHTNLVQTYSLGVNSSDQQYNHTEANSIANRITANTVATNLFRTCGNRLC